MNKSPLIAAIGDCCMDIYPEYNQKFPGGTAFNVALYAKRAGAKTSFFSAIGTDVYADIFKSMCKQSEIDTSDMQVIKGKTSHVDIQLDAQGKPDYLNWELGVLAEYKLNEDDKKALETYDAARIVLLKPMAKLFEQFCDLQLPQTLKVADFAGSSMYSEGITIVEKYAKSLDILIKSIDKNEEIDFLRQLAIEYPQKIVLALAGEKGSIAFTHGKEYTQPAIATKVVDTNGAGDAFVAYFLTKYLQTKNIEKALLAGTKAASKSITHPGAINTNSSAIDKQ